MATCFHLFCICLNSFRVNSYIFLASTLLRQVSRSESATIAPKSNDCSKGATQNGRFNRHKVASYSVIQTDRFIDRRGGGTRRWRLLDRQHASPQIKHRIYIYRHRFGRSARNANNCRNSRKQFPHLHREFAANKWWCRASGPHQQQGRHHFCVYRERQQQFNFFTPECFEFTGLHFRFNRFQCEQFIQQRFHIKRGWSDRTGSNGHRLPRQYAWRRDKHPVRDARYCNWNTQQHGRQHNRCAE